MELQSITYQKVKDLIVAGHLAGTLTYDKKSINGYLYRIRNNSLLLNFNQRRILALSNIAAKNNFDKETGLGSTVDLLLEPITDDVAINNINLSVLHYAYMEIGVFKKDLIFIFKDVDMNLLPALKATVDELGIYSVINRTGNRTIVRVFREDSKNIFFNTMHDNSFFKYKTNKHVALAFDLIDYERILSYLDDIKHDFILHHVYGKTFWSFKCLGISFNLFPKLNVVTEVEAEKALLASFVKNRPTCAVGVISEPIISLCREFNVKLISFTPSVRSDYMIPFESHALAVTKLKEFLYA